MKYTVTIKANGYRGWYREASGTADDSAAWPDVLERCFFPALRGVGFVIPADVEKRTIEAAWGDDAPGADEGGGA